MLLAALLALSLGAVDDPAGTVPSVAYRVVAPPGDAKLDPFYKKMVDVGGLPVVSSGKVSDYSLLEAAYLVREMLRDRPDILDALGKSGTRLAVMAVTERTTDIPEHSDLIPWRYWDRRARGLGATPIRPVVSCGEENLLCLEGDPYAAENILVHEFGHAIHDMGLRRLDPAFDRKLRATYDHAMKKGLWKGKYAAVNHHEYWAEGVQSWFGTNRHDDHDHNHVDTRAELEEYDSELADLIKSTFKRTDWQYRRPAQRPETERRHLAGFDPSKAPHFAWAVDGRTDRGQVLSKWAMLERQTFWDNRDWDWYERNIPFLETPDTAIDTTYYYRWELLTKHLTYGSPNSGYSFTEFIDRPFWSGRYGAISCPAGHQIYESRWLRDPRVARDYVRYWLETPGAQPRRYSTWLADAAWALERVHPDAGYTRSLLDGLVKNYEGWEREHFNKEAGLFAQSGHDDGMEYNINSRQTKDILRGDWAYRPTLNSYMWADARAIARIARLAGDTKRAEQFESKAQALKTNLEAKLWDERRAFYFPRSARDETREGATVKAGSLTYQTGKFAGNSHGRELIGYVPWQFGLPAPGREVAWKKLMDRDGFFAPFGPTVTERNDPQFLVTDHCCWWSGQSWPYATTQTLVALANVINDYNQNDVTKSDYFRLFQIYTRTHQKDGRPYIAEGANPDTGSWRGYDSPGHSDHYFHSAYVDVVITGLIGLRLGEGDQAAVNPLVPEGWSYFALDDLAFLGHRVSIVWDRDGTRYGVGKGLRVIADGQTIAARDMLGRLPFRLAAQTRRLPPRGVNYAVNNDGTAYPRVLASSTAEGTSPAKIMDGSAWYHRQPANRWASAAAQEGQVYCGVDFGIARPVHSVALKLLDDGEGVVAPEQIRLERWDGETWQPVPAVIRSPERPMGHRANWFAFPEIRTSKIRAVLAPRRDARVGLTELEAWGRGTPPIAPAPSPPGNQAKGAKVSASYTSRFDKVEEAVDGVIAFTPEPRNRWTAYESPNPEDWLEIELPGDRPLGRVDLYLYDDGGGVRAPRSYRIERWDGSGWKGVESPTYDPPGPAGGALNIVTFKPVTASRLRIIFRHTPASKSGVTEVELRAK